MAVFKMHPIPMHVEHIKPGETIVDLGVVKRSAYDGITVRFWIEGWGERVYPAGAVVKVEL